MSANRKAAIPGKVGTRPGKAASNQRYNHSNFRSFPQLATVFLGRLLVFVPAIPPIVFWVLSEVAR